MMERWAKSVRSHLPFVLWTLVVIALLVVGYQVFQALKLNAGDIGAVSGSIAAVAGALAAIAALGAARESRKTAQDATKALALATRPLPELRMHIERSEIDPSLTSMTIDIENLSVHPMRGGLLRWSLRDGTTGSHAVGEIRGRKTPFGGMIHRAEGVETLLAAAAFNSGIGGVDRVTLDYWGGVRDVTWRSILAFEFEVVPGQWWEKDGIRIPNTKRVGYHRDDVEL